MAYKANNFEYQVKYFAIIAYKANTFQWNNDFAAIAYESSQFQQQA